MSTLQAAAATEQDVHPEAVTAPESVTEFVGAYAYDPKDEEGPFHAALTMCDTLWTPSWQNRFKYKTTFGPGREFRRACTLLAHPEEVIRRESIEDTHLESLLEGRDKNSRHLWELLLRAARHDVETHRLAADDAAWSTGTQEYQSPELDQLLVAQQQLEAVQARFRAESQPVDL